MMSRDHLQGIPAIQLFIGDGQGFGWTTVGERGLPGRPYSPGTFRRGGAFGTECVIDPKEELTILFLTQVTPQPDVFDRFTALAYQMLVD
jgi:CubicO group peptidase (beta-lactamase class C family)